VATDRARGWTMSDVERTTLLARLARLIVDDTDQPLETRLCRAYLAILGGDGAAITLSYTEPDHSVHH
jgi:hypothetical protein